MDVLRSSLAEGARGCEAGGGDPSEAFKELEAPKRKESSSSSSVSVSLALQALGDPTMQQQQQHQHPLEEMMGPVAAHYYAPAVAVAEQQQTRSSHRYRSFMMEEILTEHPERRRRRKDAQSPPAPAAPGEQLLKFGVQALLSARPFHSHLVLKAEQAASLLKFPLSPLSCALQQGPLLHGSPLLPGGLQLGGSSGHHPHHHHPHHQHQHQHHLPLDLHLHHQQQHHRSKLELRGSPADGSSLQAAKKGRRSRTVFTELQLMGLEKRFEKQKYLSTPDRIDLAESLGLSQLQVKTWYQNRRMKWKKIVLQGGGLESPTKPKGRPKKNSIPSSEQLSEQERRSRDVQEQEEQERRSRDVQEQEEQDRSPSDASRSSLHADPGAEDE